MPEPTETPTPPVLDYRPNRADPPFVNAAHIGGRIVLATNLLGVVIAASLLVQVPWSRDWDRFAWVILVEFVGVLQLGVTVASTLTCLRSAALSPWFRRSLWISMVAGLAISLVSFILCQML